MGWGTPWCSPYTLSFFLSFLTFLSSIGPLEYNNIFFLSIYRTFFKLSFLSSFLLVSFFRCFNLYYNMHTNPINYFMNNALYDVLFVCMFITIS